MKKRAQLKKLTVTLVGGLALGLVLNMASVSAAPLTLSNIPLILAKGVEPNVILTFDDSGSMDWGFLPDSVYTGSPGPREFSSAYNKIYYDPNVTYLTGVDKDGASLGNSDFTTNAWKDGYNQSGAKVGLATSYRPHWYYGETGSSQAAFYYVFDSSNTNCDGTVTDNDCYDLIQHNNAAAGGAWSAAEQQNFANWYSYYRRRTLLAKTAAGRAFSNLSDDTMRIAYQRLNTCNSSFGSSPTSSCPGRSVRLFTGTDRTNFFTWLYNSPASGGTPLLPATQRAGNYLPTSNANSPWAEDPGNSIGTEHACRQNFHVAFTDGQWNSGFGVSGNIDNTSATFPDGQPYSPGSTNQKIYPDSNSSYLADNAFYYWKNDARTNLSNIVPQHWVDASGTTTENYFNPVNDPADWQHLVQYTVGLGVDGQLNYPGDYNDLLNGTKSWGSDKTDDLWHAAINSRGKYFNAKNPTELVDSFTNVLNEIGDRTGLVAAVATSSYFVSTGSNISIYQVLFNSGQWYGQLRHFTGTLTGNNLVITGPDWDVATILDGQNWDTGREILTYNPTSAQGVRFGWGDLIQAQKDALSDDPDTATVETEATATAGIGQARLEYIRGNDVQEGNTSGFNFRRRSTSKLGDIVNSAPLYVGPTVFRYDDALEAAPHSAFRSSTSSRTAMIYVGANDGMLHGFDATLGDEKIAYVPNVVFSNLNRLPSRSYTHRYYVDGSPVHGDVFFGGSWKTVLVGALNGGGQGIYALDITDPSRFDDNNASSLVLWEFTDTYDDSSTAAVEGADLGYTFSQPVITRVRTGSNTTKWAAIFGNGYNNTEPDGSVSGTGYAVLYIVDIEDGSLIKKIDTETGTTGTPNGLSTPAVLDYDGDRIADYVYAGDLQGNMWKFDLTSTNTSQWGAAFGSSNNPKPLFQAVDDASPTPNAQPITVAPQITASHPAGFGGFMVFFGTGQYLETNDPLDTSTQTIYGIWDKNTNSNQIPVDRSDLLQQQVSGEVTVSGVDFRVTTNNQINWRTSGSTAPDHLGWYMDLPDSGERQITGLDLKGGHLIFTTLVPSDDPCEFGGYGWQMDLDFADGSQPATSPFDVNQDGVVCKCLDDNVTFGGTNQPPSGRKGSPVKRTIVSGPTDDYKLENPISGGTPTVYKESKGDTGAGRQSWRQLK